MRLTYEQQCQRADDDWTDGVRYVVPASVPTTINLMPADTSHFRQIAEDVERAFRGARS